MYLAQALFARRSRDSFATGTSSPQSSSPRNSDLTARKPSSLRHPRTSDLEAFPSDVNIPLVKSASSQGLGVIVKRPSGAISENRSSYRRPIDKLPLVYDVPPPPPQGRARQARSTRAVSVLEDLSGSRPELDARNPHLLLLLQSSNPWLALIRSNTATIPSIQASMEHLFCPDRGLERVARFRPARNDVIVTSMPRAGQTAVLRILDWLKSGVVDTDLSRLPERVRWLEQEEAHEFAGPAFSPLHSRPKAVAGRLIKTHALVSAIKGGPNISPRFATPEYRVVIVLRDPLDLRVAWFRWLRRVYAHWFNLDKFDEAFDLNDFARGPSASAVETPNEAFTADALQFRDSPGVCIVFYEELLHDCGQVVRRLAEFTGWNEANPALLEAITFAIEDDDLCQPRHEKVVGSTGEGALKLHREVIQKIDDEFRAQVARVVPKFATYESVFFSVTGKPCPIARRKPHASDLGLTGQLSWRKASFTSFGRTASFKEVPKSEARDPDFNI